MLDARSVSSAVRPRLSYCALAHELIADSTPTKTRPAAAAAAALVLVGTEAAISSWARSQYESLGRTAEETERASNMMDDYTESLIEAARSHEPVIEATAAVESSVETLTEEMQEQMDAVKSTFFDVFASQSSEFKADLDSVAAAVYADMADMDDTFSTSQEAITDFAERWGLTWDEAEDVVSGSVSEIQESSSSMADTLQEQMDRIQSSFFDVFTSQSEEFKEDLDSVAQAVYDDMTDMDGSFSTSQKIISAFAERWGLTWDEAEEIISDSVSGIREDIESIPQTIEEQLIDKAQKDLEDFQNCATGKGATLGESFTESWDTLVSDTNDLISNGLVGQAQDNIQAFAECVVGKQAKMVEDIDGYLEDLWDQYSENFSKIYNAEVHGQRDLAELYRKQNEEILAKMEQLQAWKEQIIELGNTPVEVDTSQAEDALTNLTNITTGAVTSMVLTEEDQKALETLINKRTETPTISTQQAKGTITYTPMQEGGAGIVKKPTLFLAGENGPEAFAFGSPEQLNREPTSIVINPTVNNPVISSEVDVDRLLQDMGFRLVEELRRQGLIS